MVQLTTILGQNGHIGLYTASFTLANIFIVGVQSPSRSRSTPPGQFAAIVGLVLLVRFAMVSGCARIGKDAGAYSVSGRF